MSDPCPPLEGVSAFGFVLGETSETLSTQASLSEEFLVNPQTPPPEGGTAAAGLPGQPAGHDPFRQHELYYLVKISDRMDTIVVLLTFIMLATLLTALLLFRGR